MIRFKQWVAPLEAKAKGRCKLSRKNLKRLRSQYVDYCLRTYGNTFNVLFKATYIDAMDEAVKSRPLFLERFKQDYIWNGTSLVAPLGEKE